MERLASLIEENRGDRPLYFQVTGRDGHTRRVRAGSQYHVAISDILAKDLDQLLGPGRAGLVRI